MQLFKKENLYSIKSPTRSRVLNGDGFGPQVFIQRFLAQIFTKPGLLEASKRSGYVGLVVGVDEASARLQAIGNPQCLVDVAGKDTRCQAEFGIVGSLQHLVVVVVGCCFVSGWVSLRGVVVGYLVNVAIEFADDHDGTEGLFLCNEGAISNIGEDRRFEEETCKREQREMKEGGGGSLEGRRKKRVSVLPLRSTRLPP